MSRLNGTYEDCLAPFFCFVHSRIHLIFNCQQWIYDLDKVQYRNACVECGKMKPYILMSKIVIEIRITHRVANCSRTFETLHATMPYNSRCHITPHIIRCDLTLQPIYNAVHHRHHYWSVGTAIKYSFTNLFWSSSPLPPRYCNFPDHYTHTHKTYPSISEIRLNYIF